MLCSFRTLAERRSGRPGSEFFFKSRRPPVPFREGSTIGGIFAKTTRITIQDIHYDATLGRPHPLSWTTARRLLDEQPRDCQSGRSSSDH